MVKKLKKKKCQVALWNAYCVPVILYVILYLYETLPFERKNIIWGCLRSKCRGKYALRKILNTFNEALQNVSSLLNIFGAVKKSKHGIGSMCKHWGNSEMHTQFTHTHTVILRDTPFLLETFKGRDLLGDIGVGQRVLEGVYWT
jgi:hypothetical protein